MRRLLIFILLVGLTVKGYTQDTAFSFIHFKDVVGGVKKYIGESETNYLQYFLDSIGEVKLLSSYKTRFIKKGIFKGKDCLFIIQKYQSSRGKNFDTAIVDASTLKPLEYHSNISSSNYKEHAVFSGNKIKLRIDYKDSTVEKEYDNEDNVFLSTTEREIISTMPLKNGYTAAFKMVNTGVRQQLLDAYVKVLSVETIKVDNEDIDVFKVGLNYSKKPEKDNYTTILSITKNKHEIINHFSSRFGFTERKLY